MLPLDAGAGLKPTRRISQREPRSRGQRRLRPVVDERAEERAVGRLQHIRDAGIAKPRKLRGIDAALRRASGMKGLCHRAVLHGHQAGRLRAGNSERVLGLVRVETKDVGGSGRCDEDTGRALIVEAGLEHPAFRRQSDPDADLVGRDHCGDEVASTRRSGRSRPARTQPEARASPDAGSTRCGFRRAGTHASSCRSRARRATRWCGTACRRPPTAARSLPPPPSRRASAPAAARRRRCSSPRYRECRASPWRPPRRAVGRSAATS